MFRKQSDNLPALVTPDMTNGYGPTFAQRAASKAVARVTERRTPVRRDATNWERYERPSVPVRPAWVYEAETVQPVAKLPDIVTTQMRLVGDKAALTKTIIALETAGFKVVSTHYRKTRDVDSTEMILTATLIATA